MSQQNNLFTWGIVTAVVGCIIMRHAMNAQEEVEIELHAFLTSILRVERSFSRPVQYNNAENPRYSRNRGGFQSQSGRFIGGNPLSLRKTRPDSPVVHTVIFLLSTRHHGFLNDGRYSPDSSRYENVAARKNHNVTSDLESGVRRQPLIKFTNSKQSVTEVRNASVFPCPTLTQNIPTVTTLSTLTACIKTRSGLVKWGV
jgi:hypothetical protein